MEREFNDLTKKHNLLFFHILELIRIWNSLIPFILVIFGTLLAGNLTFESLPLAISFMFMYFGATILNDIFDFETDRINAPYRPLQTKKISKNKAKKFAILSYLIAILLVFFSIPQAILPIIITIFLSIIYSIPPFSLKDKIIVGVFDLSFLTIFMPIFTGYFLFTKIFDINVLFFIIFFTLTFMFVALLKDLKDLTGDIATHKRTIAIKFGKKKTSYISTFGFTLCFLSTMYFFSIIINNFLIPLIIFLFGILKIYSIESKIPKNNQYFSENSFSDARLSMFVISISLILTLLFL
jgi:geranylgeranylglycerol-phosphate geranylgeranyltransferase